MLMFRGQSETTFNLKLQPVGRVLFCLARIVELKFLTLDL